LIDQCKTILGETALTRHQRRIKESLAPSPCYRHHAH
jgi:hypothetical protein